MSEQIPEVMPTITMSKDIGQYLESLDVDVGLVTEYLRERGLSDSEIEALTIDFTNREMEQNGQHLNGEYKNNHVLINYVRFFKIARHGDMNSKLEGYINKTMTHEFEHRILEDDEDMKRANRRFMRKSLRVSEKEYAVGGAGAVGGVALTTLVAPVTELVSRPEIAGFYPVQIVSVVALGGLSTVVGRKLGLFNKEDHEHYMNNPEEIRAREAGQHVRDFVQVTLRPMDSR